jgi:protein-tyrosine kinase
MSESQVKGEHGRRHFLRIPWSGKGTSRNGREHGLPLFAAADGTVIGEQFRVLRTRVEAAGPGTFMISSALGQEGKTLCAMNLTLALSMRIDAGVILVDADLRRSSAGVSFGITGGPGVADCLMGEARWQDCLVTTKYDGLRLLPSGRRTALAPELLASARMQTVVAELKVAFPQHYILFDTPPILMTADPLVLARHMDHVLLVVRAGVTPRAAVSKAIEALGADCFMGIILNDATDSVSDYYHYRHQYAYADRNGSDS